MDSSDCPRQIHPQTVEYVVPVTTPEGEAVGEMKTSSILPLSASGMPPLDASTMPSLSASEITPLVSQALSHLQENPEMLRQMAGQVMNSMDQMPPGQMDQLRNMAMGAEGKRIREAMQGKMTRKQAQKMQKEIKKEKAKAASLLDSASKVDCFPALVINRSRKVKNGKYQGLPEHFVSVDLPYGLKIYYNPADPTENKRVSRLIGKKVGGEGWIVKQDGHEGVELTESVLLQIEEEMAARKKIEEEIASKK